MTARRHVSSPSGRRSERGVAVVEFSFVALFMLTLVAGTFDFGLAWRSGLAVNEAARTGARVGSGVGNGPGADFDLLSGVQGSLIGSGLMDDVELVVIYRSATVDGTPPTSCIEPPYSGSNCNVLTGAQFRDLDRNNFNYDPYATPPSGTGCMTSGRTSWSWCSTSRNNSQAGGDYLGVYVRMFHDYLFPIMGDGQEIERTAVMKLEPEVQ